jgi:hypothetical protein
MAFLIREALETSSTIQEAIHLFESSKRTCEYYYLIADGKTNENCGIYATATQFEMINPGAPYALLAPRFLPGNYGIDGRNDKFFSSSYVLEHSEYQTAVYQDAAKKEVLALFHRQPKDCITMTGYTHPKRYPLLIERLMKNYGAISLFDLEEVIKPPVTCETNLHNAIFVPADLRVWVSHAGKDGKPASEQPYNSYHLEELLTK